MLKDLIAHKVSTYPPGGLKDFFDPTVSSKSIWEVMRIDTVSAKKMRIFENYSFFYIPANERP
jgi:hypothetical protein